MLEDFEALILHIRKYRWWYASGALHLALLLTIYFMGPYELHKERDEVRKTEAREFVKKAYKKDIDRKLNDIKKIEDVMGRMKGDDGSEDELASNTDSTTTSTSEDNGTNTTDSAKTPEESSKENSRYKNPLADQVLEAQELLDKMQEMNIEADAEKLAYLANMPLERALEEMKNAAEETKRFDKTELEHMSNDEIRDVMKEYHDQARDYLEEAVKKEEKEKQGLSIALTPGLKPDLTSSDGSSSETNKNGSEGNGSGDGSGGNDSSGAGMGADSMSALAEAKSMLSGSGSGGAAGTETGSGEGTANFKFDPNARVNSSRPKELVARPQNRVAGRTIGSGGALTDRLYLDTWYMVGPFDFYGRHKSDKPYPPELDVDLDAVYMGKDNRFIRWEYYQTNTYPLVPNNPRGDATYYGYTEVHFDEPTTAMLGIGCDDDCKLWINGEFAWKSGEAFKPWYIGGGYPVLKNDVASWNLIEDYKKVHFPKGTTRLMFRLDNGYSLLFFAMTIEKLRS